MCATDRTDWQEKLPIVGTNTAPPRVRDLIANPAVENAARTWAEKIKGILKTHGAIA